MIITKLELENWMRIRKLVLEFSQGINLIYGRNEIGKSSIIEAIRLAITGDASSGSREYKKLKPWGTDAKAKVDLFFTTRDNRDFRISKSFPKGSARLYQKDIPLTEEAKKTHDKLLQILGLSEKTTNLFNLLFIDQGETLNIFSKQRGENPMNEETKSFIKDVVKETAFKALQEFQDNLNREWNTLFTAGGKLKKGQNASEYSRLLDREKELNAQKQEVEEKMTELLQRLEEMEVLEKDIDRSTGEKNEKERRLAQIKVKETKLAELERKKLEFDPIEKDYKRFLDIEEQLVHLNRELPRLYGVRKQVIAGLETEINRQKEAQKEIHQHQAALKQKKKECERLETFKQTFERLEEGYRELQRINESIRENDKGLPVLFALNREKLAERAGEIQAKIDDYLKQQSELQECEAELKTFPKMTKNEIDQMKKIASEISKLENRLEAARSALKMNFKLTPHPSKSIPFDLKIDDGESTPHTTTTPMEVKDFQRLFFQYPDTFEIDISGRLAEVDIEALMEEQRKKQVQLTGQLKQMKVKNIEELEDKFQQYTDLNNRKKDLQDRLALLPALKELEKQKAEIEADRDALNRDMKAVKVNLEGLHPDETLRKQSFQALRDELTKAKTNRDNLTLQVNGILKGQTVEAFEKEYTTKEKEYAKLREALGKMEPLGIKEVTQKHLDEVEEKLKALEKKIAEKERDKTILESMPGSLEFEREGIEPPSGPAQTPQQIRDDIHEKQTRLQELDKQKDEILGEKKKENFKKEYLLKKDELDSLAKGISGMVPLKLNSLKEVKEHYGILEKEISAVAGEIENNRSRKARLSGEIEGFSGVMAEKNQVEYNHKETLENIKSQLTDIYALKLLIKLIEEEKEKAQREVFKPLEERVARSLELLVPGRYRPVIDNDFEIGISARTLSGDYLEGIEESLSFGTREQLSFLLRLAIAEQLSQKEPQMMILDDSFVNTDTTRLPCLLDMIEQSSREIQFLIFTCKQDDYLRYRGQFHTINLETLM